MSVSPSWVDTHCHLDAPELFPNLPTILEEAAQKGVKAILIPAVQVSDFDHVKALAHDYAKQIPGLVYTLGIHPLYIQKAKESDLLVLKEKIETNLEDPRFVGIGEIGLDYFVEGLDPLRQDFFFQGQLDLAQQFQLPVVLHVRRSQDAILKALRQRTLPGGIAHAFNGSFQQAEQLIGMNFKLGFGGAATYTRALQIRRLLTELPLDSIVTETDAPDIPPAWLRDEGAECNSPSYLPRIASELADIRGISHDQFALAVRQNASQALPRWSSFLSF